MEKGGFPEAYKRFAYGSWNAGLHVLRLFVLCMLILMTAGGHVVMQAGAAELSDPKDQKDSKDSIMSGDVPAIIPITLDKEGQEEGSAGDPGVVKEEEAGKVETSEKEPEKDAKAEEQGQLLSPETVKADMLKGMKGGTVDPEPDKDAEIPAPEDPGKYTSRNLIFVGDSRTEAMHEAVGEDGSIWSHKVGAGYDWMTGTGIPAIEPYIGKDTAVIILMGINDPSHLADYITYTNVMAHEWSAVGAETYYVAVGPVAGDPDVTNEQLAVFNDSLEASLAGVTFIDIFTPMMENGFSTLDGTHYPDGVSIWIYNYILQHLNTTGGGIWG